MTQYTLISSPTVVVNNTIIAIVPNSLSYTEGFGAQSMKTQSSGGNSTARVYSDNAETKFSIVKFKLFATQPNLDAARAWKANWNGNAITVSGMADNGVYMSRNFSGAALTNDYEVNLGADKDFDIEFHSDPAV